MNRSTSVLNDAVLGNSDALDAVLGSIDSGADTSIDDEAAKADNPQGALPEFSSQRRNQMREQRKRKLARLRL